MQVKKFEARTMKEALEMVKEQLGPDAIILSARDNKKSFGLVGEGSVEITAAVSEDTLQKKKFVESRMKNEDREKLMRSSAKVQRQLIDKVVSKYVDEHDRQGRPITNQRYIDIADEGMMEAGGENPAGKRIKSAAERAWNAMQANGSWVEPKVSAHGASGGMNSHPSQHQSQAHQTRPTATEVRSAVDSAEVRSLKGEIASLKQVISNFQAVPQSIVGTYPGVEYGLSFDVSHMYEKLTSAGISGEIAADILNLAQENMSTARLKNKALVDAWVAKFILETTVTCKDRSPSRVQVFVGPSGSGKTSTLVKMASHLVVKESKKVAILSLDNFKVGAADQLKIYAGILNVPFAVIRGKEDWERVSPVLAKYDYVLVDFPSTSLKSVDEISKMKSLMPPDSMAPQVHLVLSALAKDSDLTEIGKRFRVLNFKDVIFTALDESVQHGNIYNFMRRFEAPLNSFGIGSRVPEDFEIATKERLLDLIFKLTKVKKEQN